MIIRKLLGNRGLGLNLIAGCSFLFLAVYGWGLSWKDMGSYLLVILVFLVGLISLAAACGWLLRKLMGKAGWGRIADEANTEASQKPAAKEGEFSQPTESGTKPDIK